VLVRRNQTSCGQHDRRADLATGLMLSAHIRRITETDRTQFADWLQGEEEHSNSGFIKDMRLWKSHTGGRSSGGRAGF